MTFLDVNEVYMYAWFDVGKLFIMNYHNKQIQSMEVQL